MNWGHYIGTPHQWRMEFVKGRRLPFRPVRWLFYRSSQGFRPCGFWKRKAAKETFYIEDIRI